MRRSHVLCIAALLAGLGAFPAIAQQVRSQVVRYGDLNLDNPQGARVLVNRIVTASGNVCDDRSGPRPLAETGDVRECAITAQENAVSDVDHPMVTAEYYGERGGNVVVGDDSVTVTDSGAPVYDGGSKY